MQRTCPRPRSDRPSGFSLVELLVAMLVLSILVAAAARGLITSLHADETSTLTFEGGLLLQRIEAAAVRGASTNETAAMMNRAWRLHEDVVRPTGSNDSPWRVWTLELELRPSLRLQRAIRAD